MQHQDYVPTQLSYTMSWKCRKGAWIAITALFSLRITSQSGTGAFPQIKPRPISSARGRWKPPPPEQVTVLPQSWTVDAEARLGKWGQGVEKTSDWLALLLISCETFFSYQMLGGLTGHIQAYCTTPHNMPGCGPGKRRRNKAIWTPSLLHIWGSTGSKEGSQVRRKICQKKGVWACCVQRHSSLWQLMSYQFV